MKLDLSIHDVANLYGNKFFALDKGDFLPEVSKVDAISESTIPEDPAPIDSESVEWKLKENSKVLFILHPDEYSNNVYSELLRKIVLATGIPLANAGFGIIRSGITETEMENFPCKLAVIFDKNYNPSYSSLLKAGDNHIWFSHKLANLSQDENHKRELFGFIKIIIEKLNSPDA